MKKSIIIVALKVLSYICTLILGVLGSSAMSALS